MKSLPPRGSRVARAVEGNIVWLTYPARARKRLSADPVASLKQSVADLALTIGRAEKLRTDIAAAISARRYEVYRRSTISGPTATERGLAHAQRVHLNCLLKFVHTIAAAGAADPAQEVRVDPLARSIGELKTSMQRAKQLSRDVLAHTQCRDWSSLTSRPPQL